MREGQHVSRTEPSLAEVEDIPFSRSWIDRDYTNASLNPRVGLTLQKRLVIPASDDNAFVFFFQNTYRSETASNLEKETAPYLF
jgi:hypothetical protein